MWRKLLPILIITFLLYFIVLYKSPSLPSNFDVQSYRTIGALTLAGKSIYPDPAISRHPYLPLFLYFEAGTQALSVFFKIPQILFIKGILSFFHLVSVYAVYILSKKNMRVTFFYAINPLSLPIIAFHGQFDIIPITCILFAIIALQKKEYAKTILMLSGAVAVKTWPILFILPFLKRIPKKYYIYLFPIPILTLLIYSLVFHVPLFSILRVLLVYQGVGSIWGFGKLLSFISTDKLFLFCYKILFALGILLYSFKQKKRQIVDELLNLLFFFFIFTPGFGIQWFLWLIPFLFLTKRPFTHIFLVALAICLCVAYLSWFPFFPVSKTAILLIFFLTWILFIGYTRVWDIKIPAGKGV